MARPARSKPAPKIETKLQRLRKRAAAMHSERTSWEPHWRDIQHFISPRSAKFALDEGSPGRKKDQHIINNSPTQASKTLAAGMMSGLTSPSRPWFRLMTPSPDMMEFAAVKQWLFIVETRIRDVLARSNFYQCLPNVYRELGDYGTACMMCDEDDTQVVRFYALTIGTYWLATDYRGDVDTLYRKLKMTVRQVVDKFGRDSVKPQTRTAYDNQKFEQQVCVHHMIAPNVEREHGKQDGKNKKWASCYWEDGTDKFLRESGYDEKPFFAPRWDVLGNEVYGSSPGMDALGDAKMLQVREKQFALAVDKHVDPPLVGGPDLRNSSVNALPGTVTFANPQAGGVGLQPIYTVAPDYTGALKDKQDIIKRIRDTYYTTLFLMLQQQEDAHFTPEVARMLQQEKMLALGPVLERLNNEFLDVAIDRVFAVMVKRSQPYWGTPYEHTVPIPPPPPELQDAPLRVEYISILAQAQKSLQVGSIQQVLQFAGAAASMNPTVLDKLDFDQALDEYATDLGAPPSIVVSDDKVKQIREAKQKQQTAEHMAAMAPAFAQYAKAAKDAGDAVAQPGSLLGAAGAALNAGQNAGQAA